MPTHTNQAELTSLRELSARLGHDPLLVQASSGNVSVKLGNVLWIKASGKWLAHAMEDEILVPVDLAQVRECVRQDIDPAKTCGARVSVETSMHAVLPHPVAIHVHSVSTIAWAVRRDGPEQLEERLAGLRWQWIPYVASGLPLARAIEQVLVFAPDVLVLGNHGLVVCGETCSSAEALLYEVEKRLAIAPRRAPCPDVASLAAATNCSGWCLPESTALHALGTDPVARKTVGGGVLYPCQAIFLNRDIPIVPRSARLAERPGSVLIVEDCGIYISRNMTCAESVILAGLMQVAQRIDESAPIRYLTSLEVDGVLNADTYRYRACASSRSTI